jgi:hypothetical protein
MKEKKPHCRFNRHKWAKREATEGDVYGECTHCGERDWGVFAQGAVQDHGAPLHENSMGVWTGRPPSGPSGSWGR